MSENGKGAGGVCRTAGDALPAVAVAAVAVLNALKEGTRQADGTLPAIPPVGDLLFDLAGLHVENMKQLAKVSQSQAEKLLEHFKQQRGALSGRSTLPRALVSVTFPASAADRAKWKVTLVNKTDEKRTYTLPQFAEFVRIPTSDCNDSVFGNIEFRGAPNGKVFKEIEVPQKDERELYLNVVPDPRFTKERYRASALLEPSAGLPLELIIELLVVPPAPPTTAPKPPK